MCPLAEAVKLGSIEMIDALLSLGARAVLDPHSIAAPSPADRAFNYDNLMNRNAEQENLSLDETPFWLLAVACWMQDKRVIDHLFKTQDALQNPEIMAQRGARALFLAVYPQNQELVTELLDRGVGVNASIPDNLTAIVAAVIVNSTRLLRLLMSRGADVSDIHAGLRPGYDKGLLLTAVCMGAMDCALELLPSERRTDEIDRALGRASGRGDVPFVESLLDGALPSTANAVHRCLASTWCPLTVDLLLSRRPAELFSTTELNRSLTSQCGYKGVDVFAAYLAHGANVDGNVWTTMFLELPLLNALKRNDSQGAAIAQLLLESGAETSGSILRRLTLPSRWHEWQHGCKPHQQTSEYVQKTVLSFSVQSVDFTWCSCSYNYRTEKDFASV